MTCGLETTGMTCGLETTGMTCGLDTTGDPASRMTMAWTLPVVRIPDDEWDPGDWE